ncbi:MAG: hypothetical protein HY741_27660 [Chloroflexi bacterium]|nr:hypothetical protein [Chloroflexota bacterium]
MGAFDRFPRVVERLEQLEAPEQQALGAAAEQSAFDFIARFPPFDLSLSQYARRRTRGKRPEPPLLAQIWARQQNRLYVLRRTTEQLRVEPFVLEDILTFELGEILLHDWIELEIQAGTQTRSLHVDFNAVGLDWIQSLVNELRVRVSDAAPNDSPQMEAQIAQFPYKWQMLAHKHAHVYGELARILVYEPSISPRWFGRSGREGKLGMFMPQHVVLVREPLESYPYGWITKSCVRSKVQSARVTTTEQTAALELTLGAHDFKWQIEMTRAYADALQVMANELHTAGAFAVS